MGDGEAELGLDPVGEVQAEPAGQPRGERGEDDPVEGLPAEQHVVDGLDGPSVADLAVGLGPQGPEALQRRPEPLPGHGVRLPLGPHRHVAGRRGGDEDVEGAGPLGQEPTHVPNEVLPAEGLVRHQQVAAHGGHLLLAS